MSFEQFAANIAEERLRKMRGRVKKLLVLSRDSAATENVSQASMLHAQRIMAEYNISEEEAMSEGVSEKAQDFMKQKEAYHKPVTDYMNIPSWYFRLSNVIAENFKCFVYRQHWVGSHKSKEKELKRIIFLGTMEDVTIAAEVFEFAVNAITFLSNDYMDTRKDVSRGMKTAVKNTYIVGYIDGLKAKFAEQVTELQIALVKDEIVLLEFDKLETINSTATTRISADKDAHEKGFRDGKNFDNTRQRLT